MKKIFFLLFVLFSFSFVNAQIVEPVKWITKTEKVSDSDFLLICEGTIANGWHLYSQFTPEGGPLPLELKFKNAAGNFELIGKAKESKTKREFNEIFEVDEVFFEKKVIITQKIKLLKNNITTVVLDIDYQVCKEACINANKTFNFNLSTAVATSNAVVEVKDVNVITDDSVKTNQVIAETDTLSKSNNAEIAKVETAPLQNESKSEKGFLTIFFLAFFSGFAALLTPCVFPMIPMTVSFFTKQSKTKAQGIRNAILYGVSIILIYVLLGSLVTAVFGADALNALSTNVWFNIIFFVLLVVFASSFLGAFEIMLPNSWANKVDQQADRGGVVGILFMALALAIVSFSCTGPIVGTLLVEAASKGGIAPIIGMLGFSLALALPFMLFAMFPGWLNSLPKSGGWLNTVKVFLGFLELALAFKFLSNADLVLQMHFLEREVFLAIWIAIFGTLAFYLFGKITLPHDSPLSHISVGRLSLGIIVLSFTIYLIPGLFGAPLKLISAFPPPIEYSESPFGLGNAAQKSENIALPNGAKLGPHGIIVFDDYEKGLLYAKEVKKPIMLDFTGYACVNCRKMENNIWSENNVLAILKKDVVVISLYVDDKRDLPLSEQKKSVVSGQMLETVGDKWTDFMIAKYNTNTQPLYVITDLEGNSLNKKTPTISYTPDAKVYENWLRVGISNFKK